MWIRAPTALPQGASQSWSLNLAAEALTDGRRFRILLVRDHFASECLGLVADTSLPAARVAREQTVTIERRGDPPAAVCQRQRHGVDQQCGADLVSGQRGRPHRDVGTSSPVQGARQPKGYRALITY